MPGVPLAACHFCESPFMPTVTKHCCQSISLSRPGEQNRTAYCMEPFKHAGACAATVQLDTFEGQVLATVQWQPISSSPKGKQPR